MCVRRMRPPVGGLLDSEDCSCPLSQKPGQKRFPPQKGGSLCVKDIFAKNFWCRERFHCRRLRSAAVTRLWPRGLRSSTPLGLTLSGASSSRSSAARPWLRYSRRTHSRRQRCRWLGSCIPVRPLARLVIIAARDRHRSRRATRSETRSCRDRSAHAARISRRV